MLSSATALRPSRAAASSTRMAQCAAVLSRMPSGMVAERFARAAKVTFYV